MNYLLNVKSSSIVHTLLSNCVKLLGKVQKLLIKCISYSVISKRILVVPTVPTNFKSGDLLNLFGLVADLVRLMVDLVGLVIGLVGLVGMVLSLVDLLC